MAEEALALVPPNASAGGARLVLLPPLLPVVVLVLFFPPRTAAAALTAPDTTESGGRAHVSISADVDCRSGSAILSFSSPPTSTLSMPFPDDADGPPGMPMFAKDMAL